MNCQHFGSLLEVMFSSTLWILLYYTDCSRVCMSAQCPGQTLLPLYLPHCSSWKEGCLKSFPLLPYSEPSCPSAMSDGKISVPGPYQMKGIQAGCGHLPSRGTMKYLFSGWEQRDSSSFLCQLEKHTKLLKFKFCAFSFVTNLLSIARMKLAREFIYMTVPFRLSNKSFEPVNIFVYGH